MPDWAMVDSAVGRHDACFDQKLGNLNSTMVTLDSDLAQQPLKADWPTSIFTSLSRKVSALCCVMPPNQSPSLGEMPP